MGLPGNTKAKGTLLKSFMFAFQGISGAVKTERNLKIHLGLAAGVLFFGWYFSVSRMEWLFLLAAIFGTITLEMVNSAIERTVDLVSAEFHPLAKQAKDIAAGAVLVFAFFSVLTGLIIFIPKLLQL